MDKLLEKIFDINKFPAKIVFVICLCCAVILFVPAEFLTRLSLTGFLADYGKYIGIVFIISSSLLMLAFINYVLKVINWKVSSRRFKKRALEELQYLNMHERALLREFYIQDKFAIQIPILDETMIGLVNKGIIYPASNVGPVDLRGPVLSYSLMNFIRERLTNEMLGLPLNPTEQEKRQFIRTRPSWAWQQEGMDRFLKESIWF